MTTWASVSSIKHLSLYPDPDLNKTPEARSRTTLGTDTERTTLMGQKKTAKLQTFITARGRIVQEHVVFRSRQV